MNCRSLYSSCICTLACLLLMSCRDTGAREQVRTSAPAVELESFTEVNRRLAEKDKDIITAFIRRKGWTMEADTEGFYHMTLQKGRGEEIKQGTVVEVLVDIYLLDGTPCYLQQTRSFRVNETAEMSGLHKALLGQYKGSTLRLIFPPHLAYGLPGDRNRIPPRSILLLELKIEN